MVQVVWFKRDLRTADHRPLWEAAAAGPVLPLYVAEPDYWVLPDTSRRQWIATREALDELAQRLKLLGAPLVIRTGSVTGCLARIHRALGITRLLAHQETGNGWTYARDRQVHQFCQTNRIPFIEYPQFGVIRGLKNRDDWGRRHAAFLAVPPIREPQRLTPATAVPSGQIPTADDLRLPLDSCANPQSGGRSAALDRLDRFFAGAGADYRRAMSSPLTGARSCSRLSVPLATGAISMREVLARAETERAALSEIPPGTRPVPLTAIDSLISRLHWHCHFIQKLESQPDLEFRSLHPAHEAARSPGSPAILRAWATGQTGFPFLDACMRSLIATGWLNFRMRAMVQAFATYQLALDWHASGTVLARLFTDYEPGIHWPQAQMQSGQTGINTPRIYNPVKQGLDQDPEGTFTRTWVPELATVPPAFLQTPWLLDTGSQPASYPAPIVDLTQSVRLARERLTRIRQQPGYRADAERIYTRHGSRQRPFHNDNPTRRRPASTSQLALNL